MADSRETIRRCGRPANGSVTTRVASKKKAAAKADGARSAWWFWTDDKGFSPEESVRIRSSWR